MASTKTWSYKTGERGRNRVRAYEDGAGGILLLEYYETGADGERRKRRVSLGHRDRDEAKQKADKAAAKLGTIEPSTRDNLTLGKLFDMYLGEVTPDKGKSKRSHDRRCVEMFTRLFGAGRRPSELNQRDWTRFIRQRRKGELKPSGSRQDGGVGNRTIGYDLKFLLSVLNWATKVRDRSGNLLLTQNPLRGLELPKEKNPKRPILTEERYRAMLAVAEDVDWRFRTALVLANETGHRSKAIRHLRWPDVDFVSQRITWDAEADKIGLQHQTPLTEAADEALRAVESRADQLETGWVLPAPRDASKPCSRHILRDWWNKAEELAGLEPIEGLGWHGLRRKFATEMQDAPPAVLCSLGGWKDFATIQKCYQQPDEEAMQEALQGRRSVA